MPTISLACPSSPAPTRQGPRAVHVPAAPSTWHKDAPGAGGTSLPCLPPALLSRAGSPLCLQLCYSGSELQHAQFRNAPLRATLNLCIHFWCSLFFCPFKCSWGIFVEYFNYFFFAAKWIQKINAKSSSLLLLKQSHSHTYFHSPPLGEWIFITLNSAIII